MAIGSSKKNNSSARQWMLIGGLVIVLFFLFFGILKGNQPPVRNDSERVAAFALDKQPMLGNADAPVTLIEFADFKCPACKNFAGTVIPKIKSELIDTGKAKLYFVNFPFIGVDSTTAAWVAESIYVHQPDVFWKYYELVYANQGDEKQEWATVERLSELAKQAGANVDTLRAINSEIASKTYDATVKKDIEIGTNAKVSSTPTLFINDSKVGDPFNFDMIAENVKQAGTK